MAGQTLVFTVCTAEQHPFALVLADSLPSHVVFKAGIAKGTIPNDERAVNLAQLPAETVRQMQERYDEAALAAALKPFYAAYFFQESTIEQIIYVDPTVLVTGDLNAIELELQTYDIILTPRLTRKFGTSAYGDEKFFLNTGMYDAGFWAIRRSENTFRWLNWWQQRLADRAYFDLCNGMNHDQLWLNYVPVYFDKVLICKNIGWNVGLHNLHERLLTRPGDSWWVNQTEPLLFFNFRECMTDSSTVRNILKQSGAKTLYDSYLNKLNQYTARVPAVFSVKQAAHPTVPARKRALRRYLSAVIDTITYFPLYHKITK